MLSRRLRNDGKATISLNQLQLKFIKQVEKKIKNKHYSFEKVNCVICDSDSFELISEKDKHGLLMYISVCKNCGLVQTNPRMTKLSYNEFYNNEYRPINTGKKKATEDFFNGQYKQGKIIFNFLKHVLKTEFSNKFVVEIGPGAGGILKFFKDKGNEVVGIDIGSEYVEFGKQKGLDLKVGTVNELASLKKNQI